MPLWGGMAFSCPCGGVYDFMIKRIKGYLCFCVHPHRRLICKHLQLLIHESGKGQ